ncbi:MAG: cytochrome C oxidase subunit IV family protein [Gemmataceae bacterium]|nr:cytochrome C oxidase subunit IV family protein [Gemmataceae bacterium]
MTDSHGPEGHHGPTMNIYLVVFGALCGFTLISFVVNAIYGIGSMTGLMIIMLVAVVKATLVTMYFMHVKYDWGKLFFLIIPLMILAMVLMVVLMPDTVMAWHHPVE